MAKYSKDKPAETAIKSNTKQDSRLNTVMRICLERVLISVVKLLESNTSHLLALYLKEIVSDVLWGSLVTGRSGRSDFCLG